MISVQNVSKFFGSLKALDCVSFEIKSGEVVGFLGPNGAGKTTMMRIIAGIFPASEGNVLINGKNLFQSKAAVRSQIGYLAEHNPLYRDMTAKEFLFYVAALKGVGFWNRKREVESVIDQCDLGDVRNRLIGKLSKGYQQRTGLAQALIENPSFLILDEPTNGLDPKQISDMRKLIRSLSSKRTIFLSTHILSEVQATCQRVLILNEGRLMVNFELSELTNSGLSLEDIFLKVVTREEVYV
jgi:ABC-2 type transport system ATP-binding protein